MPKGPWDRKMPMPLATRLFIGLAPLALSILIAVRWVMEVSDGDPAASGLSLAGYNLLVILGSLWAVFFIRRTWPHA